MKQCMGCGSTIHDSDAYCVGCLMGTLRPPYGNITPDPQMANLPPISITLSDVAHPTPPKPKRNPFMDGMRDW